MKLFRSLSVLTLFLAGALSVLAQAQTKTFSRYDTLRGTVAANRIWWDVNHYGITVKPDIDKHTIEGTVLLDFTAVEAGQTMQIDLQSPMEIRSVTWKNTWTTVGELSA